MGSAPSGPSGPPFPNRTRRHADARTLWLQNSTNVFAQNVTCRGGEGVAFGSVGQYAGMVSARPSSKSQGVEDGAQQAAAIGDRDDGEFVFWAAR